MTQKVFTLFILISVLAATGQASGQSIVSEDVETSECQTNSGVPGVIFLGHFGTLTTPETFSEIALDDVGDDNKGPFVGNGQVEIFVDLRYHQEIAVFAYPNADTDRKTTVYFTDASDRIISECDLTVLLFDVSKHDLAGTSRGYCRFGQRDGVSQLNVGTSRVFDLPEDYRDGATSKPQVLDYSPVLGARGVRFIARSEGYAVFNWVGEDTGNGRLKGLCPFVVLGEE